MADRNTKVMTMVEKELNKDPEISNQDLYDKAIKIDKGVKNLTARQFNAMYPLQVKRGLKTAEASPNGKRKKTTKPNKKAEKVTSAPKEVEDETPVETQADSTAAAEHESEDGHRIAVRQFLLSYTQKVASANPSQLVDLGANIDSDVDQLLSL